MERERWEKVYRLLMALDTHEFRGVFQAAAVLAVYFWALVHDRPVSWACKPVNWDRMPFRKLPSQPTMSRRLKQADAIALWQRVEQELAAGLKEETVSRWWTENLCQSVLRAKLRTPAGAEPRRDWPKDISCLLCGDEVLFPSLGASTR